MEQKQFPGTFIFRFLLDFTTTSCLLLRTNHKGVNIPLNKCDISIHDILNKSK